MNSALTMAARPCELKPSSAATPRSIIVICVPVSNQKAVNGHRLDSLASSSTGRLRRLWSFELKVFLVDGTFEVFRHYFAVAKGA
jgi:hypothetical protein